MLGGVDHKVRGGSRQGGSVERGLGRARDSRARGRVERHASRPGDLGGLGEDLFASSAGRMGVLSAPPDPREA